MAFYQNYKFKTTQVQLTSVADFTSAVIGTQFEKTSGEVFEKVSATLFKKVGIAGTGGGVGTITKFHAAGDGVKTVYTGADFVEPGFFYKTGAKAVDVWIDGVLQYQDVFSETSPTSITFTTPPPAPAPGITNNIEVRTTSSYTTSGNKITEYRFTGDGVKTAFTVADMNIPGFAYTAGNHELMIDIGGVMQNTSDYVETNNTTVTFNVAPTSGVIGVIKVIGAVLLADAIPVGEIDNLRPKWKNVTGNITAVKRDGLFVDTTLTPIYIATPAAATSLLGDYFIINDAKSNFGINNCIVTSDTTIMGQLSPMIISTNNASVELVFTGSDWRIV